MRILLTTMQSVASSLRDAGITFRVHDASLPEHVDESAAAFTDLDLDARYERRVQPLSTSYLELLAASSQYVYVQFDDQLTVGLSSNLLSAAAGLLERFDGVVSAVGILWPVRVEVDDATRPTVPALTTGDPSVRLVRHSYCRRG